MIAGAFAAAGLATADQDAAWFFGAGSVLAWATALHGLLRGPHRQRGPLLLIWIGVACWVAGDVAWSIVEQVAGRVPGLSAVDVLYLAGYPLIAVGVAFLVRDDSAPVRDGLLDGAALAAASSVLVWALLDRVEISPGERWKFVVTASYPLADVFLVAGVLWLALTGAARRSTARWLTVGLTCTLVLDVAFALTQDSAGWPARLVDAGYTASYGLLSVAFLSSRETQHGSAPDRDHRLHPARIALLGASLFAAPVAATVGVPGGALSHDVFLLAVTMVTASVVLTRFTITTRSEERTRSELRYRADHDELTGLLNRRAFVDAVHLAIARAQPGVVLYLDLDGLKAVNDRFGHSLGDRVVQAAASCLRAGVRQHDDVGRLGGDEFAALCRDTPADVAQRVLQAFRSNACLREHGISVSIGVAPLDSGSAHDVLAAADEAMYAAKRAGGDTWRLAATAARSEPAGR